MLTLIALVVTRKCLKFLALQLINVIQAPYDFNKEKDKTSGIKQALNFILGNIFYRYL